MRARSGSVVGLLVWLTACAGRPVEGSPGILPPSSDGCAAACENLRRLGCEEGTPTPGGVSCEGVCRNAAESGIDLTCTGEVTRAASCEEARLCAP